MNVTISSMMLSTVYQTGVTWRIWAFWLTGFCPFVLATWEEYYTGSLTLGRINGPTDGVILAILFAFYAAYRPGFWGSQIESVFPNFPIVALRPQPCVDLILVAAAVGMVPTVLANLNAVYSRSLHPFKHSLEPIVKLFPFMLEAYLGLLWTLYSPSRIFFIHPRIFMWGLGFLFGNMICKLMLAHLTGKNYKIWRSVLIPLAIAVPNSLIGLVIPGQKPLIPENICLYFTAIFACCTWLHFVYNVILEITAALNIKCFIIPYPNGPLVAAAVPLPVVTANHKNSTNHNNNNNNNNNSNSNTNSSTDRRKKE